MDTLSKATQLIEEAAERRREDMLKAYSELRALCESPIEELLLAAIIAGAEFTSSYADFQFFSGQKEFPREHVSPFNCVDVHLQAVIGPYRVDFLFDDAQVSGRRRLIIVECDGHDFHERTKEQARRDKQRDRYLTAAGYTVLRFTGSEIYANPEAIFDEIVDRVGHGKNAPA